MEIIVKYKKSEEKDMKLLKRDFKNLDRDFELLKCRNGKLTFKLVK